jgi:MFS family permease
MTVVAAPAAPGDRASVWSLGVLVLLGLYTYMDRQIIALQAAPIQQALSLGDARLGLVQGAGVALVTAVAGYPLGWLADRSDRRRVLAACLAVWCVAVALCGFATSFPALLLASAAVGAAEAGLLPIAYAAIPEWFQGRRRQAANSAFVFLGRLSAGLMIVACGALIHAIDGGRPRLPAMLQEVPTWRLALVATALPGLLLIPLVLRLAPMQPRATVAPKVGVLVALRSHPAAFTAILAGAGLLSLGASALGSFVPVAAARAWGLAPFEVGRGMGAAAMAGAVSALAITALLGRLSDLVHRPGLAMRWAAAALACAAVAALCMPLARSATPFLALFGLGLAGVMTAVMLLPTALQPLCPAPVRVRLMSLFVGTSLVVGSIGPVVVGALSDGLGGSGRALIGAMTTVSVLAYAGAPALLGWGAMQDRAAPARFGQVGRCDG